MKSKALIVLFLMGSLGLPQICPAPIVWHPDTGWQTEGKVPIKDNPKDQIEQGKQYEAKKDWENALNSYRVTLRLWGQSPYAAEARYREAQMLEKLGDFSKAFDSYQRILDRNPNDERFNEILRRQYEIANLFLKGERLKIWRIKTFPSMDRTVEMFEKIIKNGPYSEVAPMCHLKIGEARDKQKLYQEAVNAYQKIIDEYPSSPLTAEAYYRIARSWHMASDRADYDQSAANRAALAFEDFLSRYPKHEMAPQAEKLLAQIADEQARGLWQIAQFYDLKTRDPNAALVYYNDLIARFPKSEYAEKAKPRLETIKKQQEDRSKPKEEKQPRSDRPLSPESPSPYSP